MRLSLHARPAPRITRYTNPTLHYAPTAQIPPSPAPRIIRHTNPVLHQALAAQIPPRPPKYIRKPR